MTASPAPAISEDARSSLRLASVLLLAGQLLYIAVTQLHADGDANNHPAVFAAYARSGTWTAVHLGQFAGMAVLLMGLVVLSVAADVRSGPARWAGRFGFAFAVAALALYGALQAVDGVALKQAVDAWAAAPPTEKAARFASAEAIRWLEWGMRSYQDVAQGLALLAVAVAVARSAWARAPVAYLMALAAVDHLAQGWIAGAEGFTQGQSIAIVAGWVLNLAWMGWLALVARRTPTPGPDRSRLAS